MQENWIGKSEGVRFAFPHDIQDADGKLIQDGKHVRLHHARRHHHGRDLLRRGARASAGRARRAAQPARSRPSSRNARRGGTTEAELATQEKKGVPTGLFVTHPLTGEQVEVWVGNYVLMSYGDGAVMGVPAHDERDFAFANKYGLRDQAGGATSTARPALRPTPGQDWYGDKQRGVTINSGKYDGLALQGRPSTPSRRRCGRKGLGEKKTTWRLRDWGVSRQRYWGTPIPIIHCDEHGAVPVPEKDLPVVLPEDCVPDGSGNPLHKHAGFHAGVVCPVVRQARRAARPTRWTPSSTRRWYFMRYCDPKNDETMVGRRHRLLDADGPVHRRHRARDPAPAVRALLDQGHARPGPGQVRRALHQAAHAGHGAQRDLSTASEAAGKKHLVHPADDVDALDDARPHRRRHR